MQAIEALKLNQSYLRLLDEAGIQATDHKYVDLYEHYQALRSQGCKMTYIMATLADQYGLAERSIYRIVARLAEPVTLGQ